MCNNQTQTQGSTSYGNSPYDSVFRTLVVEHKDLVLKLINEMFPGIHYDGDEEVKPLNDTFYVNQSDGKQRKKIADSAIEVSGHDGTRRLFHLECQSSTDGSMIIRMFEYDIQIAIKSNSSFTTDKLEVNLPESGVLYLRSTSSTPDSMTVTVHVPGGKQVSYDVPILKLKNYSCDEIFEKELYFLVPFYLFNFESEFDKIEAGNQDYLDSFKARYREIYERLGERLESGKINAVTHHRIIALSRNIIDALTRNRDVVREEAEKIMLGEVLVTETDLLLEEGRKEGIKEGIDEINGLQSWLKEQGRTDDILNSIGNEELQKQLLEEYRKTNR